MKFSVAFFVAAMAGLAAAQDQCLSTAEAVPSCGQSCLTAAGSSYGCVYTDFACQCSHSSQINNQALTQCVLGACSSDANVALSVSSQAEAVCSCVRANGGAGQSSAAGGGKTTAAVPQTTVAIGQVAAAASTPAATSKAAGSSKAAAGPSKQTALPTSAVKVSMFTGGAPYAAGSVGGLLAGVLGFIAAL